MWSPPDGRHYTDTGESAGGDGDEKIDVPNARAASCQIRLMQVMPQCDEFGDVRLGHQGDIWPCWWSLPRTWFKVGLAVAFNVAMADDLDTPAALAVLHGLASELNAAVGGGDADPAAVAEAADSLRDALWVLGLHALDADRHRGRAAGRRRARRGAGPCSRSHATSRVPTNCATRSPAGFLVRDTPQGFELVPAMPRPDREPRRRNEEPRDNMVYGVQPVREALRGRRRVHKVYFTERAAEHPWLVEAAAGGTTLAISSMDEVTAFAASRSSGPRRAHGSVPLVDAFELLSGEHPLVIVLDGVTDPATSARSSAPATAPARTASCCRATGRPGWRRSWRRPRPAPSSTCASR